MNCKLCQSILSKAAPELKSFQVDGYELLIKVRKMSPGNGDVCDKCFRKLIAKALEIEELERIKV